MDARASKESHPSSAELDAFAVGNLNPLRTAIVESHLSGCEHCAAVVAVAPGDDFIDRLHEAERSRQTKATSPFRESPGESPTPELPTGPRRGTIASTLAGLLASPLILLPLLAVLSSLVVLLAM